MVNISDIINNLNGIDYKPFIRNILNQNKDKEWVNRILDPSVYPNLDAGNGKSMTHKLGYSDTNEGSLVYPHVIQLPDGTMKELNPKDAVDYAFKNKTGIMFKTPQEAEFFTTHYKDIWNK